MSSNLSKKDCSNKILNSFSIGVSISLLNFYPTLWYGNCVSYDLDYFIRI